MDKKKESPSHRCNDEKGQRITNVMIITYPIEISKSHERGE